MAEREGFEPSIPSGIRAFQARALGQLCDLSNIAWAVFISQRAGLYHNIFHANAYFVLIFQAGFIIIGENAIELQIVKCGIL